MKITISRLKRVIKEAMQEFPSLGKQLTVWYHPQGVDNNGNGGPKVGPDEDSRWLSFKVLPSNDVRGSIVSKLPATEQKKIKRALKKTALEFDEEPTSYTVDRMIEDSSGMGLPFIIAVKEWDELDNYLNDDFDEDDELEFRDENSASIEEIKRDFPGAIEALGVDDESQLNGMQFWYDRNGNLCVDDRLHPGAGGERWDEASGDWIVDR